MKLLVAVLMLALSGVAHAAQALMPIVSDAAADAGCDDGCEGDCEGPCSPLCSDCVCSFGARSLPSALPLLGAPPVPPTVGVVDVPVVASVVPPSSPDMGCVFHPPRR